MTERDGHGERVWKGPTRRLILGTLGAIIGFIFGSVLAFGGPPFCMVSWALLGALLGGRKQVWKGPTRRLILGILGFMLGALLGGVLPVVIGRGGAPSLGCAILGAIAALRIGGR